MGFRIRAGPPFRGFLAEASFASLRWAGQRGLAPVEAWGHTPPYAEPLLPRADLRRRVRG